MQLNMVSIFPFGICNIFLFLCKMRNRVMEVPLVLTAFFCIGFLTSSRTLQKALEWSILQIRTQIKSLVEWTGMHIDKWICKHEKVIRKLCGEPIRQSFHKHCGVSASDLLGPCLLYRNKRKDAFMCSDVLTASVIAFKTVRWCPVESWELFLLVLDGSTEQALKESLGTSSDLY